MNGLLIKPIDDWPQENGFMLCINSILQILDQYYWFVCNFESWPFVVDDDNFEYNNLFLDIELNCSYGAGILPSFVITPGAISKLGKFVFDHVDFIGLKGAIEEIVDKSNKILAATIKDLEKTTYTDYDEENQIKTYKEVSELYLSFADWNVFEIFAKNESILKAVRDDVSKYKDIICFDMNINERPKIYTVEFWDRIDGMDKN